MLSSQRLMQIVGAGLAVGLLWAYWPVLTEVVELWWTDPKYSHGYFVPLFAAWLLWRRYQRSEFKGDEKAARGVWWGLPLFSAGMALHLAGNFFYFDWVSEASLLVSLAGLCVCLGGWPLARLAAPSIGFLAFMLPLPHQVEVALANPLQSLATTASTFLLQMCGFTAAARGNVIEMNSGGLLEVADACSGLGMLVTFFALITAVAIVLKRPLVDKLVLVASAVPMALIANIIRITATGILSEKASRAVAMTVYHDWAGLFMVPLALVLTWVELKIYSHLLVEAPLEAPRESLALDLGLSAPPTIPMGGGQHGL